MKGELKPCGRDSEIVVDPSLTQMIEVNISNLIILVFHRRQFLSGNVKAPETVRARDLFAGYDSVS